MCLVKMKGTFIIVHIKNRNKKCAVALLSSVAEAVTGVEAVAGSEGISVK